MNFIIHKYKWYKKGKSYLTIAFFTYIKYDALTMLDNAARKIDNLLYTEPMKKKLWIHNKKLKKK